MILRSLRYAAVAAILFGACYSLWSFHAMLGSYTDEMKADAAARVVVEEFAGGPCELTDSVIDSRPDAVNASVFFKAADGHNWRIVLMPKNGKWEPFRITRFMPLGVEQNFSVTDGSMTELNAGLNPVLGAELATAAPEDETAADNP